MPLTPQEIAASIQDRDVAWLTEVAVIVTAELRRRWLIWDAKPADAAVGE